MDKSCSFDFRDSGVCVFIVHCAHICALQACIEVLQVAAIESVVSAIDIIVRFTRWCASFKADLRIWVAPLVTRPPCCSPLCER